MGVGVESGSYFTPVTVNCVIKRSVHVVTDTLSRLFVVSLFFFKYLMSLFYFFSRDNTNKQSGREKL